MSPTLVSPAPAGRIAHHLRVDAGQTELRHVRHDDERAGEHGLVARLGPLDHLGPQDDVERARHRARRDLVGVLLDPDLLPVGELGLLDAEPPRRPVGAGQVGAHVGLRVLELLLDVAHDRVALLADERAVDELGSDLGRARHRAGDGDELADALGPEVADAGGEGQVVERDVELAHHQPRRGRRRRVRVEVEVGGVVPLDQLLERDAEVRQEAASSVGSAARRTHR